MRIGHNEGRCPMRKSLLVLPLLALFTLSAPAQPKKIPYQVEFDSNKDIERLEQSPDGKKKGIYVRVKFSITLDGSKVEKIGDNYVLVIEEDGHKVHEVALPKPV